jgi:hypothetical protein
MFRKEKDRAPRNNETCFLVPTVLFLSKDGLWFHEGVQITHERIIEQLNRNIHREGDDYFVSIGWECCKVIVEDAPYLVRGVREDGDNLILELSDFTEEKLDPGNIQIGRNNIPYALVKETKDRARFTRPAYYQMTRYLVEAADGMMALKVGSRFYLFNQAVTK